MTTRKTPFFFTFTCFSNSPISQYLNFSFHRHFNSKTPSKISMFLLAYGCHIGTPKRDNLGVTFLRNNGKVVYICLNLLLILDLLTEFLF